MDSPTGILRLPERASTFGWELARFGVGAALDERGSAQAGKDTTGYFEYGRFGVEDRHQEVDRASAHNCAKQAYAIGRRYSRTGTASLCPPWADSACCRWPTGTSVARGAFPGRLEISDRCKSPGGKSR